MRSICSICNKEYRIIEVQKQYSFVPSFLSLSFPFFSFLRFFIASHISYFFSLLDGRQLSTKACANFIRDELSIAIRKNPYQANILLGGLDKDGKGELYYIDYLGTMTPVTCAGHGYGSMFTGAIFDRMWHRDITFEQVCIHFFPLFIPLFIPLFSKLIPYLLINV